MAAFPESDTFQLTLLDFHKSFERFIHYIAILTSRCAIAVDFFGQAGRKLIGGNNAEIGVGIMVGWQAGANWDHQTA